MPALSPTMEEGTLTKWLVSEGQTVKAGDVIAEIETDKATMEVEAVDEGKVTKILVPAGTENVKVNTPIALIQGEDEADAPRRRTRGGEGRRQREAEKLSDELQAPPTEQPRDGACAQLRAAISSSRRSRPAPRRSTSRCAKRCATPWPRRCAAIPTCSSSARRWRSTRAPTR